MSHGAPTCNHGITSSYFRTCFTCMCHSQATFCTYTQCVIAVHAEVTLERLRYFFGGHRPSETAYQTMSLIRITDLG